MAKYLVKLCPQIRSNCDLRKWQVPRNQFKNRRSDKCCPNIYIPNAETTFFPDFFHKNAPHFVQILNGFYTCPWTKKIVGKSKLPNGAENFTRCALRFA